MKKHEAKTEITEDQRLMTLLLLEKYRRECDVHIAETENMTDLKAKAEGVEYWETEKEKAYHFYEDLLNC